MLTSVYSSGLESCAQMTVDHDINSTNSKMNVMYTSTFDDPHFDPLATHMRVFGSTTFTCPSNGECTFNIGKGFKLMTGAKYNYPLWWL